MFFCSRANNEKQPPIDSHVCPLSTDARLSFIAVKFNKASVDLCSIKVETVTSMRL
jgi:hypothetical protein